MKANNKKDHAKSLPFHGGRIDGKFRMQHSCGRVHKITARYDQIYAWYASNEEFVFRQMLN